MLLPSASEEKGKRRIKSSPCQFIPVQRNAIGFLRLRVTLEGGIIYVVGTKNDEETKDDE